MVSGRVPLPRIKNIHMECQKKDRQQQPGVIAATDAVESAEKIVKPVKTISRADELSEIRSYTAKAVKAKAVERGSA